MSGFETLDVDKRILLLKNDSILQSLFQNRTVNIYKTYAPDQPPPLYVVFSLANESDTNSMDGNRVFAAPTYNIEATGREIGYDVLRQVMERIDAILTARGSSMQVNNTYIGRFIRTNIIDRSELIDTVRWNYLAGMYEAFVYSVS